MRNNFLENHRFAYAVSVKRSIWAYSVDIENNLVHSALHTYGCFNFDFKEVSYFYRLVKQVLNHEDIKIKKLYVLNEFEAN